MIPLYVGESPVLDPNERLLAACASESVFLFDIRQQAPMRSWKFDSHMGNAVFNAAGDRLLVWRDRGTHYSGENGDRSDVAILDVNEAHPVQHWKEKWCVHKATFNRKESHVLYEGFERGQSETFRIKLVDARSGQSLREWSVQDGYGRAVFDATGNAVCIWKNDFSAKSSSIELFDVASQTVTREWKSDAFIVDVRPLPGDSILFWGFAKIAGREMMFGRIKGESIIGIQELSSNSLGPRTLIDGVLRDFAFDPKSDAAVAVGTGVWTSNTGDLTIWKKEDIKDDCRFVKFGPSGVAFVGGEKSAYLIDTATGVVRREFEPSYDVPEFSPDGLWLARPGKGGVVLYDIEWDNPINLLPHVDGARGIHFLKGSKGLMTWDYHSLFIWDLSIGSMGSNAQARTDFALKCGMKSGSDGSPKSLTYEDWQAELEKAADRRRSGRHRE